MGASNIGLAIDPLVSGRVRYLALPPTTPGGHEVYQLSFQATFTSNTDTAVLIDTLAESFPSGSGASGASGKTIVIKKLHDDWVTVTDGPLLAKNQCLAPMDFKNTDNIVPSAMPPGQITFSIAVQCYCTPKVYSFPLATFENSATGGARQWSGKAHDLARGEYGTGIGANRCCGPLLYATAASTPATPASCPTTRTRPRCRPLSSPTAITSSSSTATTSCWTPTCRSIRATRRRWPAAAAPP